MSTVAGDGRSGMLPSLERRGGTWCSRSEEHTSELQSQSNLVCRLLLEKKKTTPNYATPELAAVNTPQLTHTSKPAPPTVTPHDPGTASPVPPAHAQHAPPTSHHTRHLR